LLYVQPHHARASFWFHGPWWVRLCVFRCRFRTTVAAALERPRRILASSGVAVARVLINFAHCRKRSDSEYLFLNRKRKPNQHLLPDLQDLAKKAGAKFHTELYIRKVILHGRDSCPSSCDRWPSTR